MEDRVYYHIAPWSEDSDRPEEYENKLLLGPHESEFCLGESEDCTWHRDGRKVMDELNRLANQAANAKRLIQGVINSIEGDMSAVRYFDLRQVEEMKALCLEPDMNFVE